MPEGELSFSDESELAALIRRALGFGPYEKVGVVTPQFDRTDGVVVVVRPQSAEHIDKIKKLPSDVLRRIGVGVWSGGHDWTHYLFPVEWYDYIPEGYPIVTINGETKLFEHGGSDDDRRFGQLPYGWVAGNLEAWAAANTA